MSILPSLAPRSTKYLTAGLLIILLAACREQIVHNLSESEANRFITRLSEVKVMARKARQADSKWALEVPGGDALKAIQYLTAERLLRDGANTSIEKPSWLASREDQRFRHERALSGGLEATLANLPGVLEAKVHLNLPVSDPFFGQTADRLKGSAGVLLIVNPGRSWEEGQVARLVAGASGIEAQNISVFISSFGAAPQPARSSAGVTPLTGKSPAASMPVDTFDEPAKNRRSSADSLLRRHSVLYLPLGAFLMLSGGVSLLMLRHYGQREVSR